MTGASEPDLIDPIVALDAASCWLTSVAALGGSSPEQDADRERAKIGEWIQRNSPSWRSVEADLEGALTNLLMVRSTRRVEPTLEYLRMAAEATLTRGSQLWSLSGDDETGLFTKWRLPLGTLLAMRMAAARRDLAPEVAKPIAPRVSLPRRLAGRLHEVADGHVHIGASIPFDALFLMAATSQPEVGRTRVAVHYSKDSWGVRYQADVLLNAARVSLPTLLSYHAADPEMQFADWIRTARILGPVGRRYVGEGLFWPAVWRRAMAASEAAPERSAVDLDLPGDLTDLIDGPSSLSKVLGDELGLNAFNRAIRAKSELLGRYLHRPWDPIFAENLSHILRCEALLHFDISQSIHAGLDRFVEHFSNHRRARREAGISKSILIEEGLAYLVGDGGLARLEMRTSEQPQPGRAEREFNSRELAETFLSYLAGYGSYRSRASEQGVRAPLLAMPVSLIKSDAPPEQRIETRFWPPRFRFTHLWKTVEVLTDLLRSAPSAARVFGGLDVAGAETSQPNWIFHLLFEEYQTRIGRDCLACPLTFTVHAGEDYRTPLDGLRRIDEACRFPVPSDSDLRIGHALALAPSAWRRIRDDVVGPAEELLDDLVWAWGILASIPEQQALVRELEHEITRLSSQVYVHALATGKLTAPSLLEAYRHRFRRERLESMGLLNVVRGRDLLPSLGPGVDVRHLRSEDFVMRLLAMYLIGDQYIGDSCTAYDLDLLRRAYDGVRPLVVSRLLQDGIVIESCPTSNVVIGGLHGYSEHPIFDFAKEGIPCTVNSDDPGVFHATIYDEYAYLWSASFQALSEGDQRVTNMESRLDWMNRIRARGLEVICSSLAPERLERDLEACKAELAGLVGE